MITIEVCDSPVAAEVLVKMPNHEKVASFTTVAESQSSRHVKEHDGVKGDLYASQRGS